MDKVDNTAKKRVQQERLSHMCEIVILKLLKQESNEILGRREYSTFLGPLVCMQFDHFFAPCLQEPPDLFLWFPTQNSGVGDAW